MSSITDSFNLYNFIQYWDALSTNENDAKEKLEQSEFNENMAKCARTILNCTLEVSQQVNEWNSSMTEYYVTKSQEIYNRLSVISSFSSTSNSAQSNKLEFSALHTLFKCSHTFLRVLQLVQQGNQVNQEESKKLCHIFKDAAHSMIVASPNVNSSIYPSIRQILANVESVLKTNKSLHELEVALTTSHLAFLHLPTELTSNPAFHSRAFLQATKKLAKSLAEKEGNLNIGDFREEFCRFLRYYTNKVLLQNHVPNMSYILRKSSEPDIYTSEGKLKYLSIAFSVKKIDKMITHALFFYNKESGEWLLDAKRNATLSELDNWPSDSKSNSLKHIDTFYIPLSEKDPDQGRHIADEYEILISPFKNLGI